MSTPSPSSHQSLDTSHLTPQSVCKILEDFEEGLAEEIGEKGLKLLKKIHHHGSLEKHLSNLAAEGPTSTAPDAQENHRLLLENLHAWADLKKVLDSNKEQDTNINVQISTNEGKDPAPVSLGAHKGANKLKLHQSWADRVEDMEEEPVHETQQLGHGKDSAAAPKATHKEACNNGVCSSAVNKDLRSSKAIQETVSNGDTLAGSHEEEGIGQCDISTEQVGELQAQVRTTEDFTLNGITLKGATAAYTLNGLVAQGLVISGTPDGVIAVHGSPNSGDAATWKEILLSGVTHNGQTMQGASGPKQQSAIAATTYKAPRLANITGSEGASEGTTEKRVHLFGVECRGMVRKQGFTAAAGPGSMFENPDPKGSMAGKDFKFGHVSRPKEVLHPNGWDIKSGRSKANLKFIPPTMVNGKAEVHVKTEQFDHLKAEYGNLLIGSFIQKRASFSFVRDKVEEAWSTKDFTMKTFGEHSYSFQFHNDNARNDALEIGSFHIASQFFLVQPWRPFIEADLHELKTIPIWVILHKYPNDMWDDLGFSQVASTIGKPMYPDKQTETKVRTDFARVCVEIDTDCTYPEVVPVIIDGGKKLSIPVEYKWKPPQCHTCKVFGHSNFKCPKNEDAYHKQEVKIWQQKKKARKENQRQKELSSSFVRTELNKETSLRKDNKEKIDDERRWEIPSKKHTFRPRRVLQTEEEEIRTRGDPLVNGEGGKDLPDITGGTHGEKPELGNPFICSTSTSI